MALNRPPKAWHRVGAVLFWLAVWQICSFSVGSELLLASPLTTVKTFFTLAVTADFWLTAAVSLCRIFFGFLLAMAAAALLAWCSSRFSVCRLLLAPLVNVMRTVPVASFIILALIWVSSRQLSILISFLMVFPVIYANTLSGFDSADPQLVEMAGIFHFSALRRLKAIGLPAALPSFSAGCRTGIGLAFKSGIAAEVIGLPAGTIGEKLYQAKLFLSTGELFAWTAVLILLSLLCEKAVLAALKKAFCGVQL